MFSAIEVRSSLDQGNSVVFLGKTECLSPCMCIHEWILTNLMLLEVHATLRLIDLPPRLLGGAGRGEGDVREVKMFSSYM